MKVPGQPTLFSTEYIALHDFFNSTNGPSWLWHNVTDASIPWNFSNPNSDPCQDHWQGLECVRTVSNYTITRIFLDHHNLTGHLPDSMKNFQNIKSLILRGNNITGTITLSIGNLTKLTELDLSYNHFQEDIPETIGNIQRLITLNLGFNRLSGIPDTLYALSSLEGLNLFQNQFNGAISPSLGNLIHLKTLQLQVNQFSRTIPPQICQLLSLTTIDLSTNSLTGNIPECFWNLQNLFSVQMFKNRLSGSLSSQIGNLKNLGSLNLAKNELFGSIPSSIGNLTQIQFLQLDDNLLSKTIPISFLSMKQLQIFYIETNQLTGNIDFLIKLNLSILDVHRNFFDGTFAFQSSASEKMVYLDLANNLLTGSLPLLSNQSLMIIYQAQINYFSGNLPFLTSLAYPELVYFVVNENYLTSTIPDNYLINANGLFYLDFSKNLLTGKIPSNFANFHFLNQLLLANNYFTGTVPSLNNSFLLVVLDVSANQLQGSIPSDLQRLHFLEEIFLQGNAFTGPVSAFINSTTQHKLVNIDISSNQFSGAVPLAALTTAQRLASFAASSNCFSGSLSEDLCESRSLISLSLDGLTTAENCKRFLFPDLSYLNSFTVSHFLVGSVPSCLFEMPQIELLHLSGNGLTGSIPEHLNISSSLRDLSLSYNVLTGTIPQEIQCRSWQNLDLSYNKLTGTLESDFFVPEEYGAISLEVNRLSGTVPSSLVSFENVTVLNGNIFQCNMFGSDIPAHDPEYGKYFCGSDAVNNVLYAWIGAVVVLPLLVAWMLQKALRQQKKTTVNDREKNEMNGNSQSQKETAQEILEAAKKGSQIQSEENEKESKGKDPVGVSPPTARREKKEGWRFAVFELWRKCQAFRAELRRKEERVNLVRLSIYFAEIRRGTVILTAYCVLVLIPLYAILKLFASSYTVQYAWAISSLLMNGEIAAVVLFLALSWLVFLYLAVLRRVLRRIEQQKPRASRWTKPQFSLTSPVSFSATTSSWSLSLRESHSIVSKYTAEVIAVYLLVTLIDLLVMAVADFSYVYAVINFEESVVSVAAFALALFRLATNALLLRYALPQTASFLRWIKETWKGTAATTTITTALDASCSAQSPPAMDYTTRDISFLENLTLFNNIVIPGIAIVFILPDCFYNALFAADNVLSSYSYSSCYQYGPLLGFPHICSEYTASVSYSPPYLYSFQCSSKIVINYVPVYVLMFLLAGVVIPCGKIASKVAFEYLSQQKERGIAVSEKLCAGLEQILPVYFKRLSPENNLAQKSVTQREVLFSKLTMTIQINSYLTILLCFGALFPPLAIIAAASICSITFYEECWMGWLLARTRQLGADYQWYEAQLERESEGAEESSNLTIWSTLVVSCALFGYIVFDTMGDTAGWEAALPMTLVMISLPMLLLLGILLLQTFPYVLRFFFLSEREANLEKDRREPPEDTADISTAENPLFRHSSVQLVSSERFLSKTLV